MPPSDERLLQSSPADFGGQFPITGSQGILDPAEGVLRMTGQGTEDAFRIFKHRFATLGKVGKRIDGTGYGNHHEADR